ncbi:UNVERIFIED_CONTAM: hypothetical protein FKN15_074061 [Acipenser sinensis]
MSTKALSKELRDKVVERHRSGDGYKKNIKGLEYPLVHGQDDYLEVGGVWHHQDPA